jgi:hypothetical protein
LRRPTARLHLWKLWLREQSRRTAKSSADGTHRLLLLLIFLHQLLALQQRLMRKRDLRLLLVPLPDLVDALAEPRADRVKKTGH